MPPAGSRGKARRGPRPSQAAPGAGDNEIATAYSHIDEPLKQLSAAANLLAAQTDAQAAKAPKSEATVRMLYELAWCYRVQANADSDADRMKLARETADKMHSRFPSAGAVTASAFIRTGMPLTELAPPASEQKAREYYQRLIFAGPTTELACQARFEMAELLSQRGQIDPALDLLATALENQPTKPLAQRIKVRVAAALLAKNNPQAAARRRLSRSSPTRIRVAAEGKILPARHRFSSRIGRPRLKRLYPSAIKTPGKTLRAWPTGRCRRVLATRMPRPGNGSRAGEFRDADQSFSAESVD